MKYFSVREMDKIFIEKYLNYSGGIFIETGGNDGIAQSNTYHLELYKQWTGLLIEPLPNAFNKMKINRKNSICENYCLGNDNTKTTQELWACNLMSIIPNARKSALNDEVFLKEGERCQHIQRMKIEIPYTTLETLLIKHNLKNIDFFSLDVEGAELSVLQGLNLKKFRPKYILVEANFYEEINNYLESNSYKQVDLFCNADYLYKNSTI
jgi:FkbM family methyltransferase